MKTERELLIETIKILGDKDYNIIMHFNGWGFDLKMISIRCILYDLLEDLIKAFDICGKLNMYNYTYNGKKKN